MVAEFYFQGELTTIQTYPEGNRRYQKYIKGLNITFQIEWRAPVERAASHTNMLHMKVIEKLQSSKESLFQTPPFPQL
jgi:hypothetical protein